MRKETLSKRALNLSPSPTLTLDFKIKKLQSEGKKIINLTLGEPDFDTPKHIQKAAFDAIKSGYTHYAPSAGVPALRAAIAKKLLLENKISYLPSEIIVGVGTKNILYSLFQVILNKGDEVLIPTPTWSTYIEQVKLAQGTPVLVPLSFPFKLKANDFEKSVTSKTKAIILNSPSNPTGMMIEKSELQKIADLAVTKNIVVIADEIYEKITYGKKHISMASLNKKIKDLTVTINGFSKAYAMTGWRIGYAAARKEIIDAMTNFAGQTSSGTSSISQWAALSALSKNQRSVLKMTREFGKRRDYIYSEFSKIKGVDLSVPEGAFYLFVKTNGKFSAEDLLEKALVAVVPGEAFESPGFVRISFASSMTNLKEAVKRIKKVI